MMFWLVAGLLTLGASLAVLLPLSSREPISADGEDRSLRVYRDQLAELERDRERGLISAEATVEARGEIGRRILRSADEAAPGVTGQARFHRWVAAAAVLLVPALSWGVYSVIGSPQLPSQPLSARLAKNPANSTVEELVARAEAHLAANPQDGKGWGVVAPIRLRMGRFAEAAVAYRNAMQFDGVSAEREAGLGAALAGEAGTITADSRAAFERAVKLDPNHLLARFELAADDAEKGRTAEAVAAWNAMLPGLPADSPWRESIARAVAETEAAALGPAKRGPSETDVASAETMSEADRAEMIEGMVAGLDEKLRSNPQDADGWMRLIRSYMVLNKPDQARDALERGQAALGGESDSGRRLTALAASLGVMEPDGP